MVRESTAAAAAAAAAAPALPSAASGAMSTRPSPCSRGRRRPASTNAGSTVLLVSAATAALVLCGLLDAVVTVGAAAVGKVVDEDALWSGVLTDMDKEVRDNRVRVDGADDRKDDLLLVHVLFRHGDRTPDPPTFPTDPHANFSYDPVGWGNLTPNGKRTEYRIGKFLRRRYNRYIGDYREGVVKARTTDWPRTKNSLALVLAGMFPPSANDVWSEELGRMWMPIAAESTPRDQDKLLYMWDVPCPAYDRLLQDVVQSPSFQKQFRGDRNAALISYLEEHSGLTIDSPEDVYVIYQSLLSERGFNLTIPSWANDVFPDKLKPLASLFFEMDTYNRKMQRLRAGPLLKRMLHTSVARSRRLLKPDRKVYLYSAHDTTVSAVLRALQVWEPLTVPTYGITVIMEVRERSHGRVGVQLFLRNSTMTDDLHPLSIPECDHFCPLHKFVQLTSEVIPEDWDAECQAVRGG